MTDSPDLSTTPSSSTVLTPGDERPWRPWAGLAVLALPTLLLSLDVTVLHLAVPHLSRDLEPSASQMLWIIDVYGFLLASLLIAMGALGDRWGRRRLLLLGALGFGIASTVAAFAPTAEVLIAARAAMGVAGAAVMPSTLSLISSLFPDPRRRGTAIGIWASMFSVGIALGPVLGGVMLERFWWGSVFLLGLPVMAVLLVAGPRLLPEPETNGAARVGPLPVAMLIATLLGATYVLKSTASDGVSATALVVGVGVVALGTGFVTSQRRAPEPLLDLQLLGERRIRAALLALLVSVGTVGGIYLFVTQFLQLVAGLRPFHAGLSLLPATTLLIVTSVLAPSVAARAGAGRVLAAALGVSALGFMALATVSASSSHWWVVAGFSIVYAGVGPVMALGTDLVVAAAPPRRAGAAAALSETGSELGISVGIAVLGTIGATVFARRTDPHVDDRHDTLAAVSDAPGSSDDVLDLARTAFTDGMTIASVVAATLLLATAMLAWRASAAAPSTVRGTRRPVRVRRWPAYAIVVLVGLFCAVVAALWVVDHVVQGNPVDATGWIIASATVLRLLTMAIALAALRPWEGRLPTLLLAVALWGCATAQLAYPVAETFVKGLVLAGLVDLPPHGVGNMTVVGWFNFAAAWLVFGVPGLLFVLLARDQRRRDAVAWMWPVVGAAGGLVVLFGIGAAIG